MNKLTIEFVREAFAKEGYTLLSEVYVNNSTKLDYMCPKGHKHSIKWGNWKQKQRCPTCAGNAKLTIEYVKQSFETEGYTLLSTEYKNSCTKLDFICNNGHRHSIRLSDWNQGHRCVYCSGSANLTIDYVRMKFMEEGYELLSDVYINNTSNLVYKCKLGHVNTTTYAAWTTGRRCPDCYYLTKFGKTNPAWKDEKADRTYCSVWRDQEFKLDIRKRDENKCLNPYCCSNNPNDLVIHHINYNKQDCHPKNLITVCRSCNSKANYNRTWHTAWYQAILYRRYGYTYKGHL